MSKKELRSASWDVSRAWQADVYSLPVICNWFRKPETKEAKKVVDTYVQKTGIDIQIVNPAFCRENCNPSELSADGATILKKAFVEVSNPKTGDPVLNKETGKPVKKLVVTDQAREKFSASFVAGCILNWHAKQQAKVGVQHNEKPETDPEAGHAADEMKQTEKEITAAAANIAAAKKAAAEKAAAK